MPVTVVTETLTPVETIQRTLKNFVEPIIEGSTFSYVLGLTLEGGGVLDNTDLVSATLTLYDEETKSVINDRFGVDILGPDNLGDNDVVINLVSQFTWSSQVADNVFVDPTRTKRLEWHRAVFTIVFDGGSGNETLIHEMRFPMKKSFSPEE